MHRAMTLTHVRLPHTFVRKKRVIPVQAGNECQTPALQSDNRSECIIGSVIAARLFRRAGGLTSVGVLKSYDRRGPSANS